MTEVTAERFRLSNYVIAKPLSDGSGIVFFRSKNCYIHFLRLKPEADVSFFTEPKNFSLDELEKQIRVDSPNISDTLKQLIYLRIVVKVDGPN